MRAHTEKEAGHPLSALLVEQSRAEQFSSVQFSSVYCWWIYIDCKSRGGGLFLPEGRECTYVTLTFNTRYLYLFSNVSQHLTSPFTPERCSLCCRLKQENEKNTEEGEQKKQQHQRGSHAPLRNYWLVIITIKNKETDGKMSKTGETSDVHITDLFSSAISRTGVRLN